MCCELYSRVAQGERRYVVKQIITPHLSNFNVVFLISSLEQM